MLRSIDLVQFFSAVILSIQWFFVLWLMFLAHLVLCLIYCSCAFSFYNFEPLSHFTALLYILIVFLSCTSFSFYCNVPPSPSTDLSFITPRLTKTIYCKQKCNLNLILHNKSSLKIIWWSSNPSHSTFVQSASD